jgi:hypothetical protein
MPSNELSRARKAERRPDPLVEPFAALAEDSPPSFEDWRRRVEAARAADPHGRLPKGESNMPNWTTWRSLRAAAAAVLLLVVIACTVPMDYDRRAGTDIELLLTGDPAPVLAELGTGPWTVESLDLREADEGLLVVARLVGADPAELERRLHRPGVLDLRAAEVREEARGTLFDMMMDHVFHVNLDITGLSDEQINAQLSEQLAAIGWNGTVQVTRQEGFPHVMVEVEPPVDAPGGELRIELQDGSSRTLDEELWVQRGSGGPRLELGELAGLSEGQIRQRVLEQLRAQGLEVDSAQVFVQRQSGELPGGGRPQVEELRVLVGGDLAAPPGGERRIELQLRDETAE